MSRITNIEITGLESSIIASGYPMKTNVSEIEITKEEVEEKDLERCKKLIYASITNGAHAQFLTGIRVNFDVTFSNKCWVEAERYRFLEFVSSQSTMHRITKFDISKQYNKYVDNRIIDIMKEKITEYNQLENQGEKREKYLEILYSNPCGFELTARLTTNYRCLLNIYNQRYNHRLPEWREFCEELLNLPLFKEFVDAYCKR